MGSKSYTAQVLKIAQIDSAARAQGPSSPTKLLAPPVNTAGFEPITIVMLLHDLLLAVFLVEVELMIAQHMNFKTNPNSLRISHMQQVDDYCYQYVRCAEIDGERSSCAVADGYRSCAIIVGVKADAVCGVDNGAR